MAKPMTEARKRNIQARGYITCTECDCDYGPDYWASCPRCFEIKNGAHADHAPIIRKVA